MANCPTCGFPAPEEGDLCPECGMHLVSVPEAAPEPPGPAPSPTAVPRPRNPTIPAPAVAPSAAAAPPRPLARLELKLWLEETLRRFPDIRLDGDSERLSSTFLNQHRTIPVAGTRCHSFYESG